jgi:hypothetical protein
MPYMSNPSYSFRLVALVALAGCADDATTSPRALAKGEPIPVSFCCGGGTPSPWTATKLTLPTGTWAEAGAKGVNDSGVVVGYVRAAALKYRPVRWTNGVPSFLVVTTQDHWAIPQAINSGGDVVGQVQWISANASTPIQPVRWLAPGSILQTLATLGWDGWAMDINSARVAVGTSRAAFGGVQHAVKWSAAGTITDLHPVGATWSRGFGINEQGEIVGVASFGGVVHGWKWKTDNSQLDLGMVYNEVVREINSWSEAAGTAPFGGASHAVTWTPNGTVIPITGVDESKGVSISDGRRVVGVTASVPWTWRFDVTPVNLPLPTGAGYALPADVNRCGMIVGHAAGGSLAIQVPVRWTKATCDP